MKVEMLDDDGQVTEVCEATVEQDGTCEDCGAAEVVVWTTETGMTYSVCRPCLSTDEYARPLEEGK